MFDAAHIYALDIETDTSGGYGLDPTRGGITEIAISTADGDIVLDDADEYDLLRALRETLGELPPGLISTWNGSVFDWPFIDYRKRIQMPTRHAWGPVLELQPGLTPKYDPTPGYEGVYAVRWEDPDGPTHVSFDISFPFKKVAEKLAAERGLDAKGAKKLHSLKPILNAHGYHPIEVAREEMHKLSKAERKAYAASDSRHTRWLTLDYFGLAH